MFQPDGGAVFAHEPVVACTLTDPEPRLAHQQPCTLSLPGINDFATLDLFPSGPTQSMDAWLGGSDYTLIPSAQPIPHSIPP